MRTLNTLKNVIGNFANSLCLNLLRFVSRIIFIKCLSEVYLGVNGLLSNVLGLLALSELGIGTAINYSLYKPLERKNEKKIKALMYFYKKAYLIIAGVVFVAGIVILPFLPHLIKDTTGIDNLSIIYLIFLANMVIGYLFSYKRTLITADQKNYKIMPILIFYNFLTTALQIIVLLLFKNYIIYLLMQSICIVLENVTVNWYINKQYPYIKTINKEDKLDKKELKEIVVNVRALILHKVGSYVFTSTDNLIISKFIGIVQVGFYSNYVLIVNMINSFITTLTNNVVSSLGNLIATNEEDRKYKVFKEMNLICFILYGVSTVCFINLFTPFISFCFGEKFVLDNLVLYLISFNNFIFGMTSVSIVFQNASGLYDKDKFMPLLQSVVNLIISIVLAIKIGLAGVLIGTLISNLIPLIVKPSIVYKNIFKDNVLKYFLTLFRQTLLIIFITIVSGIIIHFITFDNYLLQFIVNLVVTLVIAGGIILVVYFKNDSFKGLIERAKNILQKRREA